MKQITAYEADDGTVFKTEVGAARYELAEVFRVGGVDDYALLAVEIISEHPEEVFSFLNMCAPPPPQCSPPHVETTVCGRDKIKHIPEPGYVCVCGTCGRDKISGEACLVCTGTPGPAISPPAHPACHKCGAEMAGATEEFQTCAACRTGVAPCLSS